MAATMGAGAAFTPLTGSKSAWYCVVKAAPAPIVAAKEDVPQYGDYHSTARDEMRRTFKLPGAKKVFLEPEGSLQA